jgi:hypothetical protein
LKTHWDYSKNSLLNFILQTLNGIRGTITDSVSGKGITAKVFIEKHDADSSWIYSNEPYGDYYRLIAEGTYDVTFSNSNYHSKTVNGVKVKNNAATICNVQLSPLVTANNAFVQKLFPKVSIISSKAGILIQYNKSMCVRGADIYNLHGDKIVALNVGRQQDLEPNVWWNGRTSAGNKVSEGLYVIRLHTATNTVTYHCILF